MFVFLGINLKKEGIQKMFEYFKSAIDDCESMANTIEKKYAQKHGEKLNSQNDDETCSYQIGLLVYTEQYKLIRAKQLLEDDLQKYLGRNLDFYSPMLDLVFESDASEQILEKESEFLQSLGDPNKYIFSQNLAVHVEYLFRILIAVHFLKVIEIELFKPDVKDIEIHKVALYFDFYYRLLPAFKGVDEYKSIRARMNKYKQNIKLFLAEKPQKDYVLNEYRKGVWKNKAQFIDFILTKINHDLADEKDHIKESTVKRWLRKQT